MPETPSYFWAHLKCPENSVSDYVASCVFKLFIATQFDYAIQQISGKTCTPKTNE